METKAVSLVDYKDDILHKLDDYRASGRLCDVSVVVKQGKQFPAHRAILAASCGFFSALLDADMKEQHEGVIKLTSFESDTVELVLRFVYTGEIQLSLGNAQAVLMAADFLLIDKLKVAVDEFMSQNARAFSADIFTTYQFAVQFKCEKLKSASLTLIHRTFEDVLRHSSKFLELKLEALVEIISSDDLKVSSEEVIYRAILNWVNHKEDRKDSFCQLFSLVRLCSIQEEFLQNVVVQEKLVSGNPECLKLVLKSMRSKYIPTAANIQHPRDCLDTYMNAILVFPTKQAPGLCPGPWCYIPAKNKWCFLKAKNYSNGYGSGLPVYHNGVVFLVRQHLKYLLIEQYDLKTTQWSYRSAFPYDVDLFGVACLKGVLYIIGGRRQNTSVSLVYSCDVTAAPQELRIKQVASMAHCRVMPSVVSDDKHVYVLGGICPKNSTFVPSIEKYNPHTSSWEELAQLKFECPVFYCHCALVNGKIFIIPKYEARATDVHVYDIQSNKLSKISSAPAFNFYGVLSVCEECLYLVGCSGEDDAQKTDSKALKLHVHNYDIKTNVWGTTPSVTVSYYKRDAKCHLILSGLPVRLLKSSLEKM